MFPLRRFAVVIAVLVSMCPLPAGRAAGPKTVRVGVLGLDNYQAVAYTQLFNSPKATGDLRGLRVVAAYASSASDDIEESKTNLPKWKEQIVKFDVKLVDSIDELLRQCDAVMIMSL